MAQVLPPTVTQVVKTVQPTAPVTPVAAQVVNVPDKLQNLQRQVQISGTLTAAPDGTSITLNTAVGEIMLALPQLAALEKDKLLQQLMNALQSQKPVTVTLQPGEPPEDAILLLPSSPSATSSAQAASATSALTQAAIRPGIAIAPGANLTAIVLPPETLAILPGAAPLTMPSAPQLAQLTEQLTGTLEEAQAQSAIEQPPALSPQAAQNLAAELPLAAPEEIEIVLPRGNPQIPSISTAPNAPAPATPAPATPNASVPVEQLIGPQTEESAPQIIATINMNAAPATIPNAAVLASAVAPVPPPVASLLTVGREVTINIVSVTPPSAPPPAPNAPNQIVATVVGNGPNGQLIVKTDNAVLLVRQNANAPVGTNLLLAVEEIKPALIPEMTEPALNSLQQLISALAQADPQLLQQFMQNAMPQPNAQLPATLLFLLNAFKRGDLREWLGADATDTLARIGKFELVAKITEQFTRAGTPVQDSSVGEWRAWPIPLQADGKLQMLNLYVHNSAQDRGSAKNKSGHSNQVRFLIDVRMSRIGALQLDGFVQPKKLDMIVRSEHILPAALPNELRDSYLRTLGALGYTGGLSFQVGRKHWLVLQGPARQSVTT